MKIIMQVSNITARTTILTLGSDTFPEERLLTLIRQVIECGGAIIVECGEETERHGLIVGDAEDSVGDYHAFLWSGGTMQDLEIA